MPRRPAKPKPAPEPGRQDPLAPIRWLSRRIGLAGLLVLSAIALDRHGGLHSFADARPWLAGAVAVAGVSLALTLRQGRTVLALLALAGLYAWQTDGPGGAPLQLATLSVPLLLGLLPLSSEHRPWGRRGLLALAAVGGVAAFAWLADPLEPPAATAAVEWLAALPSPVAFQPPAIAAPLAVSAVLALALLVLRAEATRRAAFWSLAALATGFAGAPASEVWIVVAALAWLSGSVESAYALSFLDALTRLPSRRALDRELGDLGRRYTVAMVDVDHFKRVNDRHGHEVGDQVLAMVGARLARSGGGARAFRYGGEEFTLLFPGKTMADVHATLEAVRRAIAAEPFTVRAGSRPKRRPGRTRATRAQPKLPITVSIGAAERNDRLRSPEEVLAAADRALYRAKRAGRNCIRTQGRGGGAR